MRPGYLIPALILVPALASAQSIKRAQYPAISPDGLQVAFSWQGDLWLVSASGGDARRLTVHPAADGFPRWAPDGASLVFASNRYGNYDLFKIRPDGGGIKRLTFESVSEYPTAISADGKFVYGYYQLGRADMFRVSSAGGDTVRLTNHPMEMAFSPALTQDGRSVVYNRGAYGPNVWKKPGVLGTAVGDIWIADNTVPLTNHRNLTKSDASEIVPMVATDGSLTFISNKSGWPNLYRSRLDGTGARKLTDHRDGTMRNASMTPDGKTVVYEFESELFRYDAGLGVTTPLEVRVMSDERQNPVADLTISNRLSSWDVAQDSKRIAIEVRGDIFLIPEKGGTTRRLTTSPRLDASPTFLDAKSILYVAAGEGSKRSFRKLTLDGIDSPYYATTVDVFNPLVSPDGKKLAFQRGLTEIVVMPVEGGEPKVLATGYFADAAQGGASFSWSPDSEWLAIDVPNDRGSNVYVQSVSSDQRYVVARSARGLSSSPKFLPNGKGVYFVAAEYSTGPDLFVVDLVPQEVSYSEDDLDKIDAPKPPKEDVKIVVVEEGIDSRMRRLTTDGASGAQASPDSKSIWTNMGGQLVSVPVAGGRSTPVSAVTGPASGLSLGPGNQKLYFWNANKLTSLPADKPGAPAAIPFEAQMSVNLRDEESALFDEIWWAMDRFYYDEKFHGKSWQAIKDKFSKIVPYAYDRTDFYVMMGEMMEELDSSHLGSTAPATEPFGNDSTGFLGVDWDVKALDQRGAYVVASIIPGSPATVPSSKLELGDRLISVDGQRPTAERPLATLLNRKAGRKVALKIERAGKEFDIEIKPDSPGARSRLEYEAWVAWQRKLVDRLSDGKLAYFHIEGMNDPSHERFLREIRAYGSGKQGAIIDVRYNGGGNTAHLALGVLIKTPWLIRTLRGPHGVKVSENIFRGDSLEIPTGLMMNSYSFSNAEIMGEGFRKLIKGPIVGERTPGYVIGTGGYGLWDGGFIRMPVIGAYAVDGENLENNGRKPDHDVPFDPNAWLSGRDPQTEKMVEELLKRIR